MKESFRNVQELVGVIAERGFLPFFAGGIQEFSIEEFCPDYLWFADDVEGPWEWKSEVMVEGDMAYGKFFGGKAGFISMEWFPDFVNYRRSVCRLTDDEEAMLAVIVEHESLLSKEIKRLCGYNKPRKPRGGNPLIAQMTENESADGGRRRESYEKAITHLQMATRVVTGDFEYNIDKHGRRYGWSIARYCTPEDYFGAERLQVDRTAEQSLERMLTHLQKVVPWASDRDLERMIVAK